MANYLTTHYKGRWRILSDIDMETNDFPVDCNGDRDEDSVYIACKNGNKIWYVGLNDSRRAILGAYVTSRSKARNIKKEMDKQGIKCFDYSEDEKNIDSDVTFKFLATDIEYVANALGAKTLGASISPISSKNLPKSSVSIPSEKIEEYKAVTSKVGKTDILLIKSANDRFLTDIVEKSLKKKTKNKKFSVRDDMKRNKMSRQVKEYIYARGFWQEYLDYLAKEIESHYAQSYYCWIKKL